MELFLWYNYQDFVKKFTEQFVSSSYMIFYVQMSPIQNKFLELFVVSVQLKNISESGLEFFMESIFIWLSICFVFNL